MELTNQETRGPRRVVSVGVGMLLLTLALGAQAQTVVINEFLASNQRGLTDGDGKASDWIEIYNPTTRSVPLAGWHLTDDRSNLRKWTFPTGTTLAPGKYLVVFASAHPSTTGVYTDPKGYLHTNFSLDKDGEYLALTDPDGAVVHEYTPRYPPQQTDVSCGLSQGVLRYFSPPTPGQPNGAGFPGLIEPTTHSRERGFYDQPFDVRILCATSDVQIRYTVDGSEPTAQTGAVYTPSTTIPITTTTVLRSAAFKTGWLPTAVTTHTYIFVNDVARQPKNPPGWPSTWGTNSEVPGTIPADYAMDPRVVDSTLPGYSVRSALLDLPTVSISMLSDDFIGPAKGIWTHPQSLWERKCSIEYLLPDKTEGFQNDCKIEMHGGSSRRPARMQKHSMRVTFTSQYGPAKLKYRLFPGLNLDEFNQLILRGGFCDSWGLVSWDAGRYRPNDAQYLRDTWMKESLGDMGQPTSVSRFVHLYVNGLYFGLYNLSERLGADFMASHLGGQPEDWEVNADFTGNGTRWRALMALDPSTFAGYTQMQQYVDLEDFADYYLLHLYADAEDWPHHNGFAGANPVSGDGKFRFFVWDQEIVLDYHGRAAQRIDNANGVGALFQKLRTSEEFRLLFADRVYEHCFNDGALTVAASQDRYRSIANWIDKAIVAESARWGDTRMSTPYGSPLQQPNPLTNIDDPAYPPVPHGPNYYFTREDSWVVERDNVLNNYLPAIHNQSKSYALLPLLRSGNLYPDLNPPEFNINGMPQHGGQISPGASLTLVNPNDRGTIYYTLDGNDPRVPGAATAPPGTPGALVSEAAAKRVLVPTQDIGTTWCNVSYNDTAWTSGAGGVGYDQGTEFAPYFNMDVRAKMFGTSGSCYLRIPFTLTAARLQALPNLILKVRYDDGFIAYLNGVEVARANFIGIPQWNSVASDSHAREAAVNFVEFNLAKYLGQLRAGDNLLAIHALNASTTSSDFLLSVELVTGESTPVPQGNPSVSPSAAAYTGPIPLTQTTHLKARILDSGKWTALHEATYQMPPQN